MTIKVYFHSNAIDKNMELKLKSKNYLKSSENVTSKQNSIIRLGDYDKHDY